MPDPFTTQRDVSLAVAAELHAAGFDDGNGVWRMVDIWESREQADRFMERMMNMVRPEELPRPDTATEKPMRESYYELHDFVKN